MQRSYFQVRDFGVLGWKIFPAAFFLSDVIDIWLPSGAEIDKAKSDGASMLSQRDLIKLIDGGRVKVGGRDFNFGLGDTAHALYARDDSLLSDYLYKAAENGDPAVVLHPQYRSSEDSLRAILQRNADIFYLNADYALKMHNFTKKNNPKNPGCIPDIVFERAKFFSNQKLSDIKDLHTREAFSIINREPLEAERIRLSVISQLIRIALEHHHIMERQGDNTYIPIENCASTFEFVSGRNSVLPREATSTVLQMSDIGDLIEILLKELTGNADNPDLLLDRHERLKYARSHIWELIRPGKNVAEEVENNFQEYFNKSDLYNVVFGRDRLFAANAQLSAMELLGAICGMAISASVVTFKSPVLLFKVVATMYKIKKSQIEVDSDPRGWPAVLVHGGPRPERSELGKILAEIQHYAGRKAF